MSAFFMLLRVRRVRMEFRVLSIDSWATLLIKGLTGNFKTAGIERLRVMDSHSTIRMVFRKP